MVFLFFFIVIVTHPKHVLFFLFYSSLPTLTFARDYVYVLFLKCYVSCCGDMLIVTCIRVARNVCALISRYIMKILQPYPLLGQSWIIFYPDFTQMHTVNKTLCVCWVACGFYLFIYLFMLNFHMKGNPSHFQKQRRENIEQTEKNQMS